MKYVTRYSLLVICLWSLVSGPALALGPVSLGVYGGAAGASLGGAGGTPVAMIGYDLGAEALIALPVLPQVGVEIEKSFYTVPGVANADFLRYGAVVKWGFLPFINLRLSGGAETLNTTASIIIGGYTISQAGSSSGTYASLGPEIEILGVMLNIRYIANMVGGQVLSEAVANVGYKF